MRTLFLISLALILAACNLPPTAQPAPPTLPPVSTLPPTVTQTPESTQTPSATSTPQDNWINNFIIDHGIIDLATDGHRLLAVSADNVYLLTGETDVTAYGIKDAYSPGFDPDPYFVQGEKNWICRSGICAFGLLPYRVNSLAMRGQDIFVEMDSLQGASLYYSPGYGNWDRIAITGQYPEISESGRYLSYHVWNGTAFRDIREWHEPGIEISTQASAWYGDILAVAGEGPEYGDKNWDIWGINPRTGDRSKLCDSQEGIQDLSWNSSLNAIFAVTRRNRVIECNPTGHESRILNITVLVTVVYGPYVDDRGITYLLVKTVDHGIQAYPLKGL